MWLSALALILGTMLVPFGSAESNAADVPAADAVVRVGAKQGYGGTGMWPVWYSGPATGSPDGWAYCIEHNVSARSNVDVTVGDFDDYLGGNYFQNPAIQGKVLWVLNHGYPAVSLSDLANAAGISSLSANDAIEATQYAIWRYTDLTFDAPWPFETPDSEAVYWHLINGANANPGLSVSDLEVTTSITAPTTPQTGDSLVGPFVVNTNQASAKVTAAGHDLVDASGDPINADAVVDGQAVYLDLRGSTSAGSATVTVAADASGPTGRILSVPLAGQSTPTAGQHAQSLTLVQSSTATTEDTARVSWSASVPATIGTSLTDTADGDRTLPWNGGTLTDTVAYTNLTPGTTYTVTGELMNKANGTGTGITGTTTFTPTQPNGSVDVTFVVPQGYASKILVAYEKLFTGTTATGTPVAVHEDINDAAQTVTVQPEPVNPAIGTSLTDTADGDRTLPWNGGTLTDTVAYTNLTPGTTYTVTGELMNKANGTGTGITGTTTFTPTQPNGSVDVTFVVPQGYASKILVAYEKLFTGTTATGTPVAVHEDINDAAQTVTVQPRVPGFSVEKTSDPADGSLVNDGDVITYTLTFRNTGAVPHRVDHTDHLSDVLDDSFLRQDPEIVGKAHGLSVSPVRGERFSVSGAQDPKSVVRVRYQVTVHTTGRGNESLLNVVTETDASPSSTCSEEDPLCTEHTVTRTSPPMPPPPVDTPPNLPGTGGPQGIWLGLGVLALGLGGFLALWGVRSKRKDPSVS